MARALKVRTPQKTADPPGERSERPNKCTPPIFENFHWNANEKMHFFADFFFRFPCISNPHVYATPRAGGPTAMDKQPVAYTWGGV